MGWKDIALLSLGALIPLLVGSAYIIVKRFVSRRVDIHGPDSKQLERIEAAVIDIRENQNLSATAIQKMDTAIGSIVPAVKITVKKIRQDMGRLEDGETINGDLEEAWQRIKHAEKVYDDMRVIQVGDCQ